MIFKIYAERNADERITLLYNNETNILSNECGLIYENPQLIPMAKRMPQSKPFGKDDPRGKSKRIRVLKIQLGLSCNYACTYCSQRFVPRADETSRKYALQFDEGMGLKIEFWGGEPLVYWKTLRPLVAALQEKFAGWENKPGFSIITNGSLLTDEICVWLYDNDFSLAISHDGPAQSVRGPDPYEDPEKKAVLMRFYARMRPEGRISFNTMMHAQNMSRKAVHDWFVAFTGDPTVPIGEGGIIDSYDEGALAIALKTKAEHFEYRRTSFNDIFSTGGEINFFQQLDKIDSFISGTLGHAHARSVGQKCGMENEDTIAVDLRGNVVTCQNVSAVSTSMNGESHKIGTLDAIDEVKLTTATHWRNRPHCAGCPVLHLCRGSCMFLEGDYWYTSCDNAYSENIALFALAVAKITEGFIPYYIEAENLPPHRQDIWGTLMEHVEADGASVPKPIRIVNEKVVVDGVEVFTASQAVEVA